MQGNNLLPDVMLVFFFTFELQVSSQTSLYLLIYLLLFVRYLGPIELLPPSKHEKRGGFFGCLVNFFFVICL